MATVAGEVDVATLRAGLASMDGRPSEAMTVIARIQSEIVKMTTNAQLLIQRQSLPTAALDNWSGIISGLEQRANDLQSLVGAEEPQLDNDNGGLLPSSYWDQVKALAVQVATASNQLLDELNPSRGWFTWALLGVLVLVLVLYVHPPARAAAARVLA
jgi:hypothetical protein